MNVSGSTIISKCVHPVLVCILFCWRIIILSQFVLVKIVIIFFLLKFFVDLFFFYYYLFQFSFICFDKTKLYFYTMFYILSRIIYIIFIFLFNVFLISTYNIVYTIKKYNIFKQIFFLSFYFGILLEYF